MAHYYIELVIWMLIAYFLGCLVGLIGRNLFNKPASEPAIDALATEPAPMVKQVAVTAPAQAPMVKQVAITAPAPAVRPAPVASTQVMPAETPALAAEPVTTVKMDRPKGISAARDGKADKLQRISGIGPKNEAILHTLGFFHFDQIAAWTEAQIAWVDDHLRFNGRIKREEWINQAELLADGKEAEFAKLFGTGGMRNNKGETLSGTRTRKP